jgi:predicted kinase
MNVPKCYQLIGVPASGKSTWVKSQDWISDCVIVSTDNFVERHAAEVGKTYNEVFVDFMPTAVDLMCKEVIAASKVGRDIIWDQTSVNVKSRKKKFQMLPDYYHIAVVFRTQPMDELKIRLSSRPGKNIPWYIVSSMIDNFEMPTEAEGFKEIWFT